MVLTSCLKTRHASQCRSNKTLAAVRLLSLSVQKFVDVLQCSKLAKFGPCVSLTIVHSRFKPEILWWWLSFRLEMVWTNFLWSSSIPLECNHNRYFWNHFHTFRYVHFPAVSHTPYKDIHLLSIQASFHYSFIIVALLQSHSHLYWQDRFPSKQSVAGQNNLFFQIHSFWYDSCTILAVLIIIPPKASVFWKALSS